MAIRREFVNSPLLQGIDEKVAFTIDTSRWPGTGNPTAVAVVIKDEAGADKSSTNLTGAASVSGDVITTPLVIALTAGDRFRIEVKWDKSGNTLEAFGDIDGEI